jgi:hypothetical protein
VRTGQLIVMLVVLCGAACTPAPTPVALGAVLKREDFSDPAAWEWYVSPTQGADYRIESGAYRARLTQPGIFSVYDTLSHADVVIDIETTQLSTTRDNAYGVMCRASPARDGDGYYFLISGDGWFTIRRGAGDQIEALIQWRRSDAINQDRAINRIRATCVGESLRLYVNGTLVGEVSDPLYRRGVTALVAGITEGGTVDISFDDLTVWAGSAGE